MEKVQAAAERAPRGSEEALRQSEERLRLLVESVQDYAIFMLDPQGRITTWNLGAERINRYAAGEVLGRHFSLFYPREAVLARHPERELEIATRHGRYAEEGWRVRKGGEVFWASVVITAIRDPETGSLRGFAKVTRDLTDWRRMEEAAREAAERAGRDRARVEQAELALRARDEFISLLAHELRTPLAVLSLKLHGLRAVTDKLTEPARSQLGLRVEGALRQGVRLNQLVDRVLDVSNIARGQLSLELTEVNLAQVVEQVAEDFRDAAAAVGSSIQVRAVSHATGLWDRERLEQVVANLLSNAVRFGGGKPIDLGVDSTDSTARLEVTDHGLGIAQQDAERIFARFERAAPLSNFAGLGLGLYITRSIVERHGGSVRVSSRPGHGSTFTVELPRSAVVTP